MLPLPAAITSQLDKASIIRLTISYLKLRDFSGNGDPPWTRENSHSHKVLKGKEFYAIIRWRSEDGWPSVLTTLLMEVSLFDYLHTGGILMSTLHVCTISEGGSFDDDGDCERGFHFIAAPA